MALQSIATIVLYIAAIIGVSVTALLMGATVLGLCLEGLTGLIAAPILAIFGWFYLVPIAVLVSVAIFIAERPFFRSGAGATLFVLAGGVVGQPIYGSFWREGNGEHRPAIRSHTRLAGAFPESQRLASSYGINV